MSKLAATGSSPIVPRKELAPSPWHEPDWQRLWLATHIKERTWRSLALVPGSGGMPDRFIERAAVSLSRTGMTHLGPSIHVADATRIRLADLNHFFAEVEHCTQSGIDRLVVALAPIAENVTTISIARHADCALLCVLRGYTDLKEAKRTVREIGAGCFVGSVMFDGIG